MPKIPVLIQVFAKNPQSLAVKTRLHPMFGSVGAQQLYQRLCRHTLAQVQASHYTCQLWTASHKNRPFFRECQQNYACSLQQQHGQNLGKRMQYALNQGLRQADKVILIGSDCPALSATDLQHTVIALNDYPVVLTPAQDGGYVLLAMRQRCLPLFSQMPWSQPLLYQKTVRRLRRLRSPYHTLPMLADLDTAQDFLNLSPKDKSWLYGFKSALALL